jgi:hypothetical protein
MHSTRPRIASGEPESHAPCHCTGPAKPIFPRTARFEAADRAKLCNPAGLPDGGAMARRRARAKVGSDGDSSVGGSRQNVQLGTLPEPDTVDVVTPVPVGVMFDW